MKRIFEKYKNLEKLIFVFLIISIPFIILGFNFKLLVFDLDFYEKEFVKNNVFDEFGKEIVDENSLLLIDYLKDDKKELDTDFFNEREKLHLVDVKDLIDDFLFLFYIILILFCFSILSFIYLEKYKRLANSLIFGGLIRTKI